MFTTKKNHDGFVVRAYRGDAKVMLAFDLPDDRKDRLAGFTIACTPQGRQTYFLYNKLQFEHPEKHAQKKTEPAYSSINAPIQKFRWLHVPGLFHQDDKVFYGDYSYAVTPRYFDEEGHLEPIDHKLAGDVQVRLEPFKKDSVELAFTRGFVQSQGFVNHFGSKAAFKPKAGELLFNTSELAGKNSDGESYTFKELYKWSGFTAREKVFQILKQVQVNKHLELDVFAYDLNEPDVMRIFLELAREGRIRMLLDDAPLHHSPEKVLAEDEFEKEFEKQLAGEAAMKRGHFGRYQHNKVFIVKENGKPKTVLSGSTNFSVTGLYVNSNHVVVFHNELVADLYEKMFDEAWKDPKGKESFNASKYATETFSFEKGGLPQMKIHFSPHKKDFAKKLLEEMVERIDKERKSVFFAVMGTDPTTTGPVAPALVEVHKRTEIFSCGITDSDNDLCLYKPSSAEGLRVTGKPGASVLPAPFDKEASIGIGHQVHHKFIVCGFNRPDAVVWFGSSNLAQGGEENNGDNLIEVHDQDLATVFAIEALALVDHFHFRDNHSKKISAPEVALHLHLYTTNKWLERYYEPGNIYCKDRLLFSGRDFPEPHVKAVPEPV